MYILCQRVGVGKFVRYVIKYTHPFTPKLGAPIMSFRNLEPSHLCNETHLIVTSMKPHVIQATTVTDSRKGENDFIPIISLIPT